VTAGSAVTNDDGDLVAVEGGPFHPTFLYELVWNLGVALLVYLLDRRWKLGRGRAFRALNAMAYCVGRFWIEALRIDEAHSFLGLRVNSWVSLVCSPVRSRTSCSSRVLRSGCAPTRDGTVHLVTDAPDLATGTAPVVTEPPSAPVVTEPPSALVVEEPTVTPVSEEPPMEPVVEGPPLAAVFGQPAPTTVPGPTAPLFGQPPKGTV
jgi:hypothetical protein